jgi:hypothetical protein
MQVHFDDRFKITGPHLTSIIKSHVTWQAILVELQQVVSKDFEDTRRYSQMFRSYFVTFDYARNYQSDLFANQDFLANSKAIRQEMMQLKKWQQDLDRMKISNCCGIFHVDSRIMKNKLVADKDEVLEDMKAILQAAARDNCDKVYADFENYKGRLSKNPASLRDFAAFVADKQTIVEECKNLLAAKAAVDDMYKLLQSQFDVKIHLASLGKWEDLHKTAQNFSEYLENADQAVSSRMPLMTQSIKAQISVLDEEAMSCYTSLTDGLVIDDIADSDEVLEFMRERKDQLEKMTEEKQVLSGYQSLLGLPGHEYANITAANQLYDKRYEIWSKIGDWEDIIEDWSNKEWSELKPEEMDLEIQAKMKDATRLFKVDEDAVSARYKKSVSRWKGFSPTLVALGNAALKERHWRKIFEALDQSYQARNSSTIKLEYVGPNFCKL